MSRLQLSFPKLLKPVLIGLTMLMVIPGATSVDSADASASTPKGPTANQIKQCSAAATGHRKMTRGQMAACSALPKISEHCAKGRSVTVIKIGPENIAVRFNEKPVRLGAQYTQSQLNAACTGSPSQPSVEAPSGPSPTTTTTSVEQVDAEIDALYYAETQAFQNSSAAGWLTIYSNDYPGSVNQSQYEACVRSGSNESYTDSAVPNLSTLMPAPTWMQPGPTSSEPYNIGQTSPPQGVTYELQVTFDASGDNTTSLVHVTILNGKAYYYEGPLC